MKKYVYTLLLFFLWLQVFPQTPVFENYWINYNQPYFRIFVVNDGIYRIDSTTLANAGISMATLNPKNIQIFGRGVEQYIYIKGRNDGAGKFNNSDYIEFYGMHNDGWYDKYLYKNAADQPNPNYSMFNDTAIYYFTINPNSIHGDSMTIESDTAYSHYTLAPYFNRVSRVDYTDTYFFGPTDSYNITDPEYGNNEGWFDPGFSISGTASISKTVSTSNAYSPGSATINFLLIGATNYASLVKNHHININFAGININDTLQGFYSKLYSSTVSTSSLNSSNTTFNFATINDLGSGADGNTVSYINIKYPHTLNLENDSTYTLYIPLDVFGQTKSYFKFSNFAVNTGDTVRFYDITNHKRIKTVKSGNYYKVLVPSGSGEKKCFITSDKQIYKVSQINPVSSNPANYAKFRDYTSIATTTDYIIISHQNLWSEATEYYNYRNSAAGGNHHSILADIDDLYDQFCYGIRKDPLAIKNFAHFVYSINNSPNNLNLFLLGKGYGAAESAASLYLCYRKDSWAYDNTLIPGFGAPPSDILFTKFDTLNKQRIPTGRLAARQSSDVQIYLDKVKDYEYAQSLAQMGTPQEWMKNVLHFGGGSDVYQQNILASFLNGYKSIIQGHYFGGHVQTFLKSSTAPMQFNLSDSLKLIINNGVSLMTFFGHGAGIGFDMSTDEPSSYNNKGKYPLIVANSCLAGDLYNFTPSSSEAFVIIQDKGAIGYIGSVTDGLQQYLNLYSTNLYKNMGIYYYGQSIGKCIQSTIDTVMTPNPSDYYNKITCLDMTFHGDPAIKLNYFIKPDYAISQSSVYFTPTNVTTSDSIFTINIISENIGRAIIDSFVVDVKRTFPDGSTSDSVRLIKATMYKDTIKFKLPVNLARGIGLNTFTVTLDYFNSISEISETNNTTTATLLITSDDITPVYPYQYAIVPSLNLTLKASTGNPFASAKNYIFELDTTDLFTHPVKKIINHSGGVVTWTPTFPVLKDSIVYYWRVALNDTSHGGYKWHESSFQYITGKRGWGQAHFFQFKNDSYQYVSYNQPARKFVFANNVLSLFAQTGYYVNNNYYDWTDELYKINGSLMSYWFCPSNYNSHASAIKIAVFDSISGDPWISPPNNSGDPYTPGPSGEFHCQGYATPAFDFTFSTASDRTTVCKFLNSIPKNDNVLVMTHEAINCSQWNDSLINAFRSIGSNISNPSIYTDGSHDQTPFIIFGHKGAFPGSVNYKWGTQGGNLINLPDTIHTKWYEGYVRSVPIGPAERWDSLHWRVKSIDPRRADSIRVNVYGIKSDGTQVELIKNLYDSLDISLTSRINSSVYPYIFLEAVMRDDTFHTPYQMVRWQVIYKEVPETAIDPSVHYSFYKDTLSEGDTIRFSTAIHNISEFNMDSLLVHYWIIDANRAVHPVYYHRYRPHPAGDILIDTVKFSTKGLSGINSLWIEANPNNDQPEQYHYNNIGEKYFYVNADHTNPLLDVTFDGVHILDNDIVSAKPLIEIQLKDENKFLLLNQESDTSLFKVYIQKPNSSTQQRIYFKQQDIGEMKYYPTATSSNNKCRIELNANFPVDGTYKLIVQATDVSKNPSGAANYQIDFEVINKSSITEVMNWPNPFSTSTRFVFTLTGSEIPAYFKIQIMTITGKIVKDINLEDLGPIHIGRNITQYAWNGKDDYGDQLANGVYLYRVITILPNGKTIDKNPTAADQYFNHEFGKMFLMR